MINYEEVNGPEWADRTFEVFFNGSRIMIIGIAVECLMTPLFYIGVDDVGPLTVSELRALRQKLAEVAAGWTIRCFTDYNPINVKFAKFMGFEETERLEHSIWYEGEF